MVFPTNIIISHLCQHLGKTFTIYNFCDHCLLHTINRTKNRLTSFLVCTFSCSLHHLKITCLLSRWIYTLSDLQSQSFTCFLFLFLFIYLLLFFFFSLFFSACITRNLSQLMRLWYFAQSRQSLRCSHTWSMEVDEGSLQNQTSSPTGWLRMRVWRMCLRRTKSAII